MNPRKAKELLPELAQKLDLPEEFLKDVTDTYWDYIRDALTNLEDYHILVPHIGTFSIKGDKVLDKIISQHKHRLFWLKDAKTFKRLQTKDGYTEVLRKLVKLRDTYFQERDRKYIIKLSRENERLKKTMEEQRTDNGGGTQLPGSETGSGTNSPGQI